jgi:hypothetical protein
MSDAKTILKMIEEVGDVPTSGNTNELSNYLAVLDKIDNLTFEYIYGRSLPNKLRRDKFMYSRSRDAVKSIRPEGCFVRINDCGHEMDWFIAEVFEDDKYGSVLTPKLPTEELAELHAIISAIEYERNN